MKITAGIIFALLVLSMSSFAQRQVEKLDRGLVAVKVANGVFLSWRVFGTDPKDVAFNVYRGATKVNAAPIAGATNLTDAAGTVAATYTVRPVLNGVEQAAGGSASVWASWIKEIQLQGGRPSNTHRPNDINVGDLDGDGQYELVLKWYPDNAKDNSQTGNTGNTYLAAYKLDGSRLWIIDLGINIRSGAHYTQHQVADFDGDGTAEVMCKTAPRTKDGLGSYLATGPAATEDQTKSYRNESTGIISTGPEYLTVFNGKTGKEMATVRFLVARGVPDSWGKIGDIMNRVDRYNSTIAYLDGKKPSAIFERGYYHRLTMGAWDWDGKALKNRWLFNSDNAGSGAAYGQGNHSIMAADVDSDGFDEILTGPACIDHDGKFKWATGHGHGDANHVGDLDPSSPGLEVWEVSEHQGTEPDHYMIRASDGKVLWGTGSGNDNGRGMTGDIDAKYAGSECWSAKVDGTFDAKGNRITAAKPASANFRIYWDGDLLDELPNGDAKTNLNNKIEKWDGAGMRNLANLTGYSCNGTKATPNLVADIIGDWREEIIFHDNATTLYLHNTTIQTDYKMYTLMHDPVYRNAASWQQSSYNQPPHLGFWLGAGIDKVPLPNIAYPLAGIKDCNGIENGTASIDQCGTCVGGNTGKVACITDCNGDANGTASLDKCGICSGGKTGITACQTNTVSLKAGWNLIGCPLAGSTAIDNALASIWPNVEVVKNLDSFYISTGDPIYNMLKTLSWGQGYLVKVRTDCVLTWQ